mmetsp:Transcript_39880/g.51405  ORF Transcript_39880/g.51405 Transcript_39880/m.51405 type:complete len:596 (-) Transcript_39880:285-2072(-)
MIMITQNVKTSKKCSGLGDRNMERWSESGIESGLILSKIEGPPPPSSKPSSIADKRKQSIFVIDREVTDRFTSTSNPFERSNEEERIIPALIWKPINSAKHNPNHLKITSSSSSSQQNRAPQSSQDRALHRQNRRANERAASSAASQAPPSVINPFGVTGQRQENQMIQPDIEKTEEVELVRLYPLSMSSLGGADGQGLPALPHVVDDVSKHFAQCIVCFEQKIFSMYPDFCYKNFRVSGDGINKSNPRHPHKVCNVCLEHHISSSITNTGKLFVRCPFYNCNRSLQTLELQSYLSTNEYNLFVKRLKEAEEFAQQSGLQDLNDDDIASLGGVDGLELRMCPTCSIRIEKNEGCSSMICYRCGSNFSWGSAALVKKAPPKPKPKPKPNQQKGNNNNNNNNNNNQPFENEQIYQSIPKVPPPQTKLWEQQQQIQLEIGRQQRKNQTYQMIESTNAKFNHVINGRSAGFDPDRFKKANFSQSSSLMSNSTPTKNTFPTTSTSASSTSPLIVASSKNIYESSKPFHHDEVHSNSSQSGGSIIPPSSLSPPSSSSSSSKSYKTMKGSPMSRKQPEAQPPNSLDFLDESLMDDILQDIGL